MQIENGEWEAYNQSRAPSLVCCAARDNTGAMAPALSQGHQFTGESPCAPYAFVLSSRVLPSSVFWVLGFYSVASFLAESVPSLRLVVPHLP